MYVVCLLHAAHLPHAASGALLCTINVSASGPQMWWTPLQILYDAGVKLQDGALYDCRHVWLAVSCPTCAVAYTPLPAG